MEQLGRWSEAHHEPLLRFAYVLTGNQEAAADLVQDAFLRLYGSSGRIDGDWGYRVVVMLGPDVSQRDRAVVKRIVESIRPG